ncbi:MAG: alpha/beta fold hydrolase [Deltaproteobacteria bacterium]|nr:alpha/beta fold hydrolase [Deltaproteobacteria bacterium]
MSPAVTIAESFLQTHDGWSLQARRTTLPGKLDRDTRPLLIVPGYGMNNFIFGYHPRGTSLERCLAEAGFEVWSFNLRAQGASKPVKRAAGDVSLHAYATVDLPAAIDHVLAHTATRATDLTLIGASLGGTVSYGYLALHHRTSVKSLITMGSPLRWEEAHPLVRLALASPTLAGAVKVRGARTALRSALPALLRVPPILGFYMNPATIDMSRIGELTRTVEDPHPGINRDIALWLRSVDLHLGGVNVTRALERQSMPLLVILSNRDGMVPEATAMSATRAWGGRVDVLKVGDQDNWYAHANLFVADDARSLVFDPMIGWLREHAVLGSAAANE